jgi:ketosteroid isomerase-like protein
MESQMAETIWALEEACEEAFRAGDHEKSISFYHDQFLGWPEPTRPLMDRNDLLRWNKKDASELGAYTFKMERSGIRIVGNTATANLIYHFQGETSDGVEIKETHRWAHTWVHDGSEWKILTGSTYPIG